LAGIEGHADLAVRVTEGEAQLWQTAWQNYPTLPWTFLVDPTAVADDYGPGCGVARLWRLHQHHQQQQVRASSPPSQDKDGSLVPPCHTQAFVNVGGA
jgi:hypothetical protein